MTTRSSRPAHWLGSVALLVLVAVGALLPAGSASGYSHDWGAPVVRLGNLDPEPVDTPASAYDHCADFSGDPFVDVAAFSHDTLAGLVLASASLGHDYDETAPRAHLAPTSAGISAVDETEVWGDSSGSAVPRVGLRLPSDLVAPSGAGVLVDGAGSGTRTINFRPNAADPNWGLTQSHVNKHLFGLGNHSLRQIDPGGNPDLWRNYIQDLAGRPSTATLKNGVEDVIGTFPRTGGGSFQFGIRIAPGPNGTWDLVTLLTKQ